MPDFLITAILEDNDPDTAQDIADQIAHFLHERMNIDAIVLAGPVSEVPPDPDTDDTLEGLSAEDDYDEDDYDAETNDI